MTLIWTYRLRYWISGNHLQWNFISFHVLRCPFSDNQLQLTVLLQLEYWVSELTSQSQGMTTQEWEVGQEAGFFCFFFSDTSLYLHRSENVQPNIIPTFSLIRTKQAMLIRCLVGDHQCSVMSWAAVAFLTASSHLISLTTLSFPTVRSLHIHKYRFLRRLLNVYQILISQTELCS